MSVLEDHVDMDKAKRVALAGVERLAESDPARARRMHRAIEQLGGAALHIGLWADGEAAIAVASVEVWRGPLHAILRRPDA
jgi:hypothetical protein